MIVFATFCLLWGATAASVLQLDSRIVGGKPIQIESAPYQLSLEYYGNHRCGAVLISATRALTAAHCTNDISAETLSIRGGTSTRTSGGQVVGVAEVVQNPNYSRQTQDYDIAVLYLATALNLGPGVQSVKLAEKEPPSGANALATGWGALREGGQSSLQLQGVALPIVSWPYCYITHLLRVTNRMMCAGDLFGGKDSCQGDSGGPLVSNGVLVGLVSWGYGCGRFASPGVYTNIANLRSFIREASGV